MVSILNSKRAEVAAGGRKIDIKQIDNFFTLQGFLSWIGGVFRWIFRKLGWILLASIIGISFWLFFSGGYDVQAGTWISEGVTSAYQFGGNQLQKWNAMLGGGYVTPEEGEDETEYGIYLPTDSVVTKSTIFRPEEEIWIKAVPKGHLLGTEDKSACVKVDCMLEDGTLNRVLPKDCIPFRNMPTPISCYFDPVVDPDYGVSKTKKVNMTLTYDFKSDSHIQLNVMRADAYEESVTNLIEKELLDWPQATKRIADDREMEYEPSAKSRITPLQIGAQFDLPQPIPSDSEFTLIISLTNTAKGFGQINEFSISLPSGITLLSCEGKPASGVEGLSGSYSKYTFTKEDVPFLRDDIKKNGDFQNIYCRMDSKGGFSYGSDNVFRARANIEVSYTYVTSGETFVKISTQCAVTPELEPDLCGVN